MKILDTSAILRSNMDFSDGGYIITNGVLSEIMDDNIREIIDLAIGIKYIKVVKPDKKNIEKAKEKARETGDYTTLSPADTEVLATAIETHASILSDDYAIQNVAAHLGIKFEKTVQDGIKKEIKWERVCIGCGNKYTQDYPGDCLICGQEVKRRPIH